LLIIQLVRTRQQYVNLFITALCGIFLHSMLSINHYRGLADDARSELDRLGEHPASVHIAAVAVTTLAARLIPG
jgi:hypothetical protein